MAFQRVHWGDLSTIERDVYQIDRINYFVKTIL